LTGLRDDPAAGWLSGPKRRSLAIAAALPWFCYCAGLMFLGVALPRAVFGGLLSFLLAPGQLFLGTLVIGVLLFPFARRFVVRFENDRMHAFVSQTVAAEALNTDDWSVLNSEPDGRAVSLVGWARRRLVLPTQVAGEPAIGIALACVQSHEGVLESVHDFDLVDENGRAILISVAGGRLVGKPNVRVFSDDDGRMLVASLDLPPGVTPTGDAFVLRDGDPVMVAGFKTTVMDPELPGMRQPPVRTALASSGGRPLLVYQLVAERRPTAGGGPPPGPG
jgi:hypothetical protein